MLTIRTILFLIFFTSILYAGEESYIYYVYPSSFTTEEIDLLKTKGYQEHQREEKKTKLSKDPKEDLLMVTPKDDTEKDYFKNLKDSKKIMLIQTYKVVSELNTRTGANETYVIRESSYSLKDFEVKVSS